ncbi:MAG: DNA cytosine methyltransferase, partial [Sphaerospermopsis kisseleviana]
TIKGDDYSTFLKKTENRDSCFNNIRINDCAPSITLTSNPAAFNHWDVCRKLTYREYKRLGSFPDDYQAKTDRIGKYIIGMSVPPRMAEQVAKAVIEQWF